MEITAYKIASRFSGIKEVKGVADNPHILAMLRLDQSWPGSDEVAWCSAFVNYVAWLLGLPRSKQLNARSWLGFGTPISLERAKPGFDVVVMKRGGDDRGPEVVDAPGHVGFFAGVEGDHVLILGGNQGDQVSISRFPKSSLLGVRRLLDE